VARSPGAGVLSYRYDDLATKRLRAGGLLDALPRLAAASTWRESSWDRSGGNRDWTDVAPGATVTLLDVDGPGVIRHLYWAVIRPAPNQYRQVVLRMYWDGHSEPCVEGPIGDLFGIAFSTPVHLHSLPMVVNPGNANAGNYPYTCGLNSYFPMPFARGARIDITNESDRPFGERGGFWYHFEYERHADASAIPDTAFTPNSASRRRLRSPTASQNTSRCGTARI
jgi:Protein of unknown function (DUF2961)